MEIDHLYVVLMSLLIGACSIGEENSSKDISAIRLNQVEIPIDMDSVTLEKAQLIHKFLVVQLNDSLEGEILKIFVSAKSDSTFNSLVDYLRLNTLNNQSLLCTMFIQWDAFKQGKKNKKPRRYCMHEFYSKTKEFNFSYENFEEYAHGLHKIQSGKDEFRITLNLQYSVHSMIQEGLENHSMV